MFLQALLILMLLPAAALAAGCAAVPVGLAGWLRFEERAEAGPHTPTVVAGKVGKGLRFDGKGQYFELPAKTQGWNPGEDNFTVELWIRTRQMQTQAVNIADKRSYDPFGWLIFLHKGTFGFQVPRPGAHAHALPSGVFHADGNWHHVAGVAQRLPSAPIVLYVDGVKRADSTQFRAPLVSIEPDAPLWLGRHHANPLVDTNEIYFAGDIDELSFYRRALTVAEIRSIYRAGSAGKCPPSAR